MSIFNFLPEDVDLKNLSEILWDSEWQNAETEQIGRNILFVQNKINPKAWSPFTWEDYRKHCTHQVTSTEFGIMQALVKGGKPVWNTDSSLSPGYLEMEDDKFVITEKFLAVIARDMVKNKMSAV